MLPFMSRVHLAPAVKRPLFLDGHSCPRTPSFSGALCRFLSQALRVALIRITPFLNHLTSFPAEGFAGQIRSSYCSSEIVQSPLVRLVSPDHNTLSELGGRVLKVLRLFLWVFLRLLKFYNILLSQSVTLLGYTYMNSEMQDLATQILGSLRILHFPVEVLGSIYYMIRHP